MRRERNQSTRHPVALVISLFVALATREDEVSVVGGIMWSPPCGRFGAVCDRPAASCNAVFRWMYHDRIPSFDRDQAKRKKQFRTSG